MDMDMTDRDNEWGKWTGIRGWGARSELGYRICREREREKETDRQSDRQTYRGVGYQIRVDGHGVEREVPPVTEHRL